MVFYLFNLSGDDAQTQVLLNLDLLPRLRKLLSHSKPSILKDTCFTLSNIAAGNHSQIQQLIDAKVFPALMLLFYSVSIEIKVHSLSPSLSTHFIHTHTLLL